MLRESSSSPIMCLTPVPHHLTSSGRADLKHMTRADVRFSLSTPGDNLPRFMLLARKMLLIHPRRIHCS